MAFLGLLRFYPATPPPIIGHTNFVFLYSFGEFRSISFAFGHLLIKWPTTLQVGNVAAAAVAAAVAVAVVAVTAAAAVAVVVVISLFKLPDKSPRDFAANSQPVV